MNADGWRVDYYTDAATKRLVYYEITPVNDLVEHQGEDECACIPVCGPDKDGIPCVRHSAFDGREAYEANSKVTQH